MVLQRLLGTAVLTFGSQPFDSLWLAGCLSRIRYQYSYLTFVSLFVPYGSKTESVEENHRDVKMTGEQWRTALGLAVVAAAIVLSNVMITVRIPSVVEQVGHGTARNCWGLY